LASKTRTDPEPGAERTKSTTLFPPNQKKKRPGEEPTERLKNSPEGGLAEKKMMIYLDRKDNL